MRLRSKAAALAAILICNGLSAAAALDSKPAPAAILSAAEQAQIREAARRGALLYAYDQAAWHGSDDMVAKLPDFQKRVGGWIVDGPAESPELVFFDKERLRAVYSARFSGGALVSAKLAEAGTGELGAARRKLVAARDSALAALARSGAKACSEAPMNSVVLPPSAPGEPILVYVLTPRRTMETFPFGGHYMIPVDSSGRAGPVRRFTAGCLELSLSDLPKDKKAAVLGVSHLLDPVPTEIHVFTSLAARLPVSVVTRDGRVWRVDGPDIRLIGKAKR